MSGYSKEGTVPVQVNGLLLVAETERAYLVIPSDLLARIVNPVAIMQVTEVKSVIDSYGCWVPKKCLKDVMFVESKLLPNITVRFPLKSDSSVYPFKCELRAVMPSWLAQEKSFIKGGPTRPFKPDKKEERRQW